MDWKERNCLCDADCARYGDCCLDSPHFVAAQQRRGAASFSCVELRQFGGIYMLTSCPPEWGDAGTRTRCEEASPRDPVASMPVTSHRTGLTYRNAHCALCHGDLRPGSSDVWAPRLECPALVQGLAPNLTRSEVSRSLRYESEHDAWVLRVPSDNGTRAFNCNIDPVLPDTAEHVVRRCPTGVIRTCSVNWTNADVRNRCEAYTALVFFQNDAYRNAHCAICNNVPVQNLACIRASSRVHDYTREFSPKAFAVLFDLNGESGDTLGKTRACPSLDQLYDPFFRRCRDVVCSTDGLNLQAGQCVGVLPPPDSTEDYPVNDVNSSAIVDGTHDAKSSHFQSCPKFLLDPQEYEVLQNGTVFVPLYRRSYLSTDFLIREDGLLEICTDEGIEFVDKFNPYMGYVTIAGLGVSIVFLVLHLTAFALLPELRNLSGKNLASLCLSLLAAYCAFIIGQFLEVRLMAQFCLHLYRFVAICNKCTTASFLFFSR